MLSFCSIYEQIKTLVFVNPMGLVANRKRSEQKDLITHNMADSYSFQDDHN